MNGARRLESRMSSWHLYFFFLLRYSFIVSLIYACFLCFFLFVFLSLQVLLAFHSVRTIPPPPAPFVEFLVDRHKVDESDISV